MKASISRNIYVARKDYQEPIDVVQSDSGRQIIFAVIDMTIPSGSTARIYALKPDDAEVYNTCTVSGQLISINLTTQLLAVVGKTKCQVQIVNSSDIVTTFEFVLDVQKSLVSGSAITSTNEFTALQTALATATGLQSSIDALNDSLVDMFPGGTNILRNTNVSTDYVTSGLWSNGIWYKFGTSYATVDKVAVTDAPNPDMAYGMKMNKTGTGADSGIRQSSIPLPIGYEYTLSCYVRSSDKVNIKFQIGETNYAWVNTAFTTTTEWQRFSVTFKALYPTTSFVFGIATTLTGNAEFCGMKLEAGNKATDWSPSPWDVTNRLTKLEAAITTLGGTI